MRNFQILITLLFMGLLSNITYGQIAVIVNNDNVISNIEIKELKKIYLGKVENWQDGNKIALVNKKSKDELCALFCDLVLDKTPKKLKTYWIKIMLGGGAIAPKALSSDSEVKEYVNENEGAIGYIDAANVDKTVKVITIDGVSYSDTSYTLKK